MGRSGVKVDLTGQKFGVLTALEPTEVRVAGSVVWRCVCACGREVLVSSKKLRTGFARSCGCQRIPGNKVRK